MFSTKPMRRVAAVLAVLGVGAIALVGCSDDDDSSSPPPTTEPSPPSTTTEVVRDISATVTGPVTGGRGKPATAAVIDLAEHGYVEEEYLVSGEAVAYEAAATFGPDGHWEVKETTTAPYTTRILVRRPADASEFNGTVVVEWLNVSTGTDLDPDFAYAAEEMLRGYAWVGVSAQEYGVENTEPKGDLGPLTAGIKAWDPERYADLDHPGDAYSYDIFATIGALLRRPGDVDPLGGLEPEVLLADGESQGAMRLVTYLNAIHPLEGVFDGALIHSRDGTGAPLGEGNDPVGIPDAVVIRDDLTIPVLQVEAEADLFTLRSQAPRPFPPARQPDTDKVVTWEIAGSAHTDRTHFSVINAQVLAQWPESPDLSGLLPGISDGQQKFVMRAALRGLTEWVVDGVVPPSGEVIEVANGAIVRDELGIAAGGIRPPVIAVPVEVNSSEGIRLLGSRTPLDPATVVAQYPTPDDYLAAVTVVVDDLIDTGFLLADDREEIIADTMSRYPSP